MKKKVGILAALIVLVGFLFVFSNTASASSANISRSYSSSGQITNGSLVSLVSSKSSQVEDANIGNSQRLVGIAVITNQSLVAINPSTSSNSTQVATEGTVNALVSTVNGVIKVGQQIAVSPFNGLGMKAGTGDRVIGTALTPFSSSTAGATTENIVDSYGNHHEITIGYVKLTIAIGIQSNSTFSIESIQQFIEALTGHPISVLRMVISMAVAFIAIVSIVTLVYASIYGSIVSIGRNPLAKSAVFRTLTSVIGMVTLIGSVASITIYFLLY